MVDFTPILDYCTCKFTPIQAYLQIFPPSIFHQIPPQTKTPRIKLAFLHGVTTDVFLLNTDYTDFTDSSVLPHNGTKDPFLVFPNKNNPCNPCNPCSKPLRITELQGISTFSESIRVIRVIRVQNPYAPRLNKVIIRVQPPTHHVLKSHNPCFWSLVA